MLLVAFLRRYIYIYKLPILSRIKNNKKMWTIQEPTKLFQKARKVRETSGHGISVAGGTETEYFRNPWRVVVTRNKGSLQGGGEGKYCKWWRAKEGEGNGDGNWDKTRDTESRNNTARVGVAQIVPSRAGMAKNTSKSFCAVCPAMCRLKITQRPDVIPSYWIAARWRIALCSKITSNEV